MSHPSEREIFTPTTSTLASTPLTSAHTPAAGTPSVHPAAKPAATPTRPKKMEPVTTHQKAEDLRTKAMAKSTQANKLLKQLQGNVYSAKVVEDLNKFEAQFQHLALTHDAIFPLKPTRACNSMPFLLRTLGHVALSCPVVGTQVHLRQCVAPHAAARRVGECLLAIWQGISASSEGLPIF